MPLIAMPGDRLLVSARPVMMGLPLVTTPVCWIVIALNRLTSVTRLLVEPSQ